MAGDRDQAQERTEQATPKRIQDAREKGQVARSRELTTTCLLIAAAGTFYLSGPSALRGVMDIMVHCFTLNMSYPGTDIEPFQAFVGATGEALLSLTPFLVVAFAVSLLAPMLLSGWSFSSKAVGFKWDKLDPVKGAGRLLSWNAFMELIKALLKFVLITCVTALLLWVSLGEFLSINAEPLLPASAHAAVLVVVSFLLLSLCTVVITFFDVPFQLWNHAKQLRMSKQDVKEEHKENEGKPEVKSRIRALQREVAQRRMMEAVPEADVVITNPTHYAVALRYDADKMKAPLLVAKGADLVAMRIREVAKANDVKIVSAPALARAVYYGTKLNGEVPAGLYVAIAQVLAYVYRLNRVKGGERKPTLPKDLPIPDELRH